MVSGCKRRRAGGALALLTACAALFSFAPSASAAGAPTISEAWVTSVFSTSTRLQARIDPDGLATSYHVDYIPAATFEANVAAGQDPFAGTQRIPATVDANIGSGGPVTISQQVFSLSPGTVYRYRVVAHNSGGSTETKPPLTFATQALGTGALLADGRGWEMVSPIDKNGGQVGAPGTLAGGGVLQAAAAGNAVTYGSSASFGSGAVGAPSASQYVARRTGAGWATENVTAPLYSGSYGNGHEGVPFQLFSGDLGLGLLLNGRHCRGEGSGCAVPNPPLPGTGAPVGYQNYYLRNGGSGAYEALLGAASTPYLALEPADFELTLAGATSDLSHVVLSSCAALTPNATEVAAGAGCDPAEANLYEFSPGAGLSLVNVLPSQTQGTPGAALGAQAGAISADGARVYFTQGGHLYLREGAATYQVDQGAAAGGEFQTASADGSVAYLTASQHLYSYSASSHTATDLTPSGGVEGVLGASADGSYVYYLTTSGLFLRHGTSTVKVAAGAAAGDYPPATGTARVSVDGSHLVFLSKASLTEYDNNDLNTGQPDSEVFLYNAGSDALLCVSCNPTYERPIGPSTIPGAVANGEGPGATDAYKPRVLSANGNRVYFNSDDAVASADTDEAPDAYQWEAPGEGSCATARGCISLLSSGKSAEGSRFVDASADGTDAFFVTDASLVPADPGAIDLYDARVGGGFPEPGTPIPCEGDACQPLPPVPVDPTLDSLIAGHGNPAVHYTQGKFCKKGFRKRGGKCVKRNHRKHRHGHRKHGKHGHGKKGRGHGKKRHGKRHSGRHGRSWR